MATWEGDSDIRGWVEPGDQQGLLDGKVLKGRDPALSIPVILQSQDWALLTADFWGPPYYIGTTVLSDPKSSAERCPWTKKPED